ncbi:MAG: hypothetical protein H7Y61_12115 [Rhizobiales bacterium]|nr:hypothetical protein [Rhizobacter sp.]
MSDLTILVNTSDGFEDCWGPFFQLFAKHWPGCPYPIVLNTETKDFGVNGLAIRAARVARDAPHRLTWSECLARCLDGIATEYVLYLQEDFFLESAVQADLIDAFLGELRAGRADVIRLMECGGSGPWAPTANPLLWEVAQKAEYRIALQAALWRKTTLRGHLRRHESPWQMEVFGSARARRIRDRVLCVNRDRFHGPGKEIFPYQPTGVVKGQWERHIVEPLFARHAIPMDFSRRGFYDPLQPASRAPLVRRVADRVRSLL